MAVVETILNNDDFFDDIVDTPKEGIEQHRKWEFFKGVISQGKAYLIGSKWTHKKEDKVSDKTINKTYTEYKQRELNENGEKPGKALGKHIINLYFIGISWVDKIRDANKLQQDTENDPIIMDQMASLGCFLVCIFGNCLAPVLSVAHTVNNSESGDK